MVSLVCRGRYPYERLRLSSLLSEHCCPRRRLYRRHAVRRQHKGGRYPSRTYGNGEICLRQLQKYILLPASALFFASLSISPFLIRFLEPFCDVRRGTLEGFSFFRGHSVDYTQLLGLCLASFMCSYDVLK